MAYQRFWFKKDLRAMTLGGGQMNNPGRYLTLLPPINNATAVAGTPYFTENPGDRAQMHDGTITLDYMPSQFITFRLESGYRFSDLTGPVAAASRLQAARTALQRTTSARPVEIPARATSPRPRERLQASARGGPRPSPTASALASTTAIQAQGPCGGPICAPTRP